jgi:hypothetical protein
MKRLIGASALGLFLLIQSGCIAVSAREVHTGMRCEAVAVDGRIYVVDKVKRTAREVEVLAEEACTEP